MTKICKNCKRYKSSLLTALGNQCFGSMLDTCIDFVPIGESLGNETVKKILVSQKSDFKPMSIKSFKKSLERFVRLRCIPALESQADVHSESWPTWQFEFEPNERLNKEFLNLMRDVLVNTYSRRSFKKFHNSSRRVLIPWDRCMAEVHEHMTTGMPEFMYLKYEIVRLENGRPVLNFKFFIKRRNCRKKRIAMMQIPL